MKNDPHNINKELRFSLLFAALVIILLFIAVSSFGQKVDSAMSRFCSVPIERPREGRLIVYVKTVKIGTIEIDEDEAKLYFKDCYEHGDTVFIKTWIDYASRSEGVATYTKKQITTLSAMAKEYNDRLRKEGRFLGDGIFIMVRMPSEQDYIKWLHNRK